MKYSIGETRQKKRSCLLVSLSLLVLVCVFALGGAFVPAAQAVSYSAEEIAFVQLINEYRAGKGLGALQVSDMLSEAADRHNSDMAKYGFFSHYSEASDYFSPGAAPWDRMAASGYGFNTAMGENIAAGYATAAAVLAGWKTSSGHNAVMLNGDFKVIGVSLTYASGTKYGFYWTTDFGGYVDSTAHSVGAAPQTTTTVKPTTTTVKPTTTTARPTTTTAKPTTTTVRTTTTTTIRPPATTTTTTVKPTTTTVRPTTTTAKPTTTTTAKPTTPTTVAYTVQFSDVSSSTLYADAIWLLAAEGVVGGYSDGRFGSYDKVTRQQFAKMIILALDCDVTPVAACSFKDVASSASSSDPLYPAGYVNACAAAGITVGTTPNTFAPYNQITRAQLITMVARAAGLVDAPAWYQAPFANFSATHFPWANRAAFAGLLDGYAGMGSSFDFWASATRGEVCLLLANLIGL